MQLDEVGGDHQLAAPHQRAGISNVPPTKRRRTEEVARIMPKKRGAEAAAQKRGFAAAAVKRVTNQYQDKLTAKPKALHPSFINAMDSAIVKFIQDLTQRAWEYAHSPEPGTMRPRKTIRVTDFEAVARDNQLLDFLQPVDTQQCDLEPDTQADTYQLLQESGRCVFPNQMAAGPTEQRGMSAEHWVNRESKSPGPVCGVPEQNMPMPCSNSSLSGV